MNGNGSTSNKPIDKTETTKNVRASQNEIEIAEQQKRYQRVLEILLKADLQVLADMSKQTNA